MTCPVDESMKDSKGKVVGGNGISDPAAEDPLLKKKLNVTEKVITKKFNIRHRSEVLFSYLGSQNQTLLKRRRTPVF